MASQREKLAAQKAAKVDKSETSKAAKVVRPSDKIAASAKKAVETRKALPAKGGTSAGSVKAVTQRGATRHKQAVKTAATVAGAFMKTMDDSAKAAKSDKRKKEAVKKAETAAKGSGPSAGPATPIPPIKGGAIVKRNETIGPKTEIKKGVKKAMTYRMSKADLKRANRRDDTSAAPKSKIDKLKDRASEIRVDTRNKVKDAAKSLKRKAGAALGKLASKLSEEGGELDSFDTVIAYLIDEEIASDFDEATAMMTKLSAETISEIHESQMTYITEISAQLAHTASMKADEVARKARISGDKETAAKKVQQASRIYKGVGPRRAKERMEKEGN